MLGGDALGMELDTMDRQLAVLQAHDGAVCQFCGDFKAVGQAGAFDHKRVIARRLKPEDYQDCDQIIVPGRCRGDLDALSEELGIKVIRGPEEIKDLPMHFGKARKQPDRSQYRVNIFAESVDAPERDIDSLVERALYYRDNGADVIDIGCLPQEASSFRGMTVEQNIMAVLEVVEAC